MMRRTTLGLAACIDDVLLPAMRQIGVWWAVGHCDVVQEQMATEAVRAWLDRRSAFAPTTDPAAADPAGLRTHPICTPSAWNRPRCCCGIKAGRAGFSGARTSTVTLAAAARATAVAGVVVVSHLATGRRPRGRIDPRRSTSWGSRSSTPETRSPPRGVGAGCRATTSASASKTPVRS